jgi:hypothetical protein
MPNDPPKKRKKYKERNKIPKYFIKSKAAEKKKKWLVGISRASTVNAA